MAGRTGILRSSDGGATWRHALVGEVLAVALSPSFEEDGTLFIGTGQDGVIRSEDGGATWSGANSGLLDLSALALALSPRFTEDRTAFVGTASGLYRSRNGARSWREVNLGLDEPAVQVLAVSPRFAEDRLVFAGTEAHGLLRSEDGGARFSEVPELGERGISAVTIAPDGRTVVVAAGSEVLRSDDGGLTWSALPEAPGLVLGLALLPTASGEVLVAGLHRLGIARLDADRGWQPANDGLRASLLTWLAPSPRFGEDRTLYGLSLDEGLLVSRDGGRSWARSWPEEADSAIAALAVAGSEADGRDAAGLDPRPALPKRRWRRDLGRTRAGRRAADASHHAAPAGRAGRRLRRGRQRPGRRPRDGRHRALGGRRPVVAPGRADQRRRAGLVAPGRGAGGLAVVLAGPHDGRQGRRAPRRRPGHDPALALDGRRPKLGGLAGGDRPTPTRSCRRRSCCRPPPRAAPP